MNAKRWIPAVLILGLWLGSIPAYAEDPAGPTGFSKARLTSLSRAAKADAKACLNFEATFSAPLREEPKAMLDWQRSDLIDGVISFFMKVTSLGEKRYLFTMQTEDPRGCEDLRKSASKVSVSVDGAVGPDGRAVMPEERTFPVR